MSLQGALMWICSLAAQDETLQCGYQSLTSNLKEAVECDDSLLFSWSSEDRAGLLLNLRNLTDKLYRLQLRECQGAEPSKCPQAEVPEDGGLLCTTVSNKRYCKPMCNHGYDFSFLRRSRLYEECSKLTGFKWQSQFIGGNKLAVCNKAHIQVSGAASAYFSEDQDCLTTQSNSSLIESAIMRGFMSELRSAGVQGDAENSCLLCG
ncbi:Peptidoglycan-N-acetylglucosamine deacetylase [Dissostichus eleginoides]|uniref:Peptidoglycan-N-acetylglucosamine deacetylase n=1 Tax=Dissostichus eleginoides TaxID=100907 RepID=A0AAD9FGQ3_DISEL|nr:Peptidoglycan-N-acetylglucosamine deacetylase [Dissostichus eleginoides]